MLSQRIGLALAAVGSDDYVGADWVAGGARGYALSFHQPDRRAGSGLCGRLAAAGAYALECIRPAAATGVVFVALTGAARSIPDELVGDDAARFAGRIGRGRRAAAAPTWIRCMASAGADPLLDLRWWCYGQKTGKSGKSARRRGQRRRPCIRAVHGPVLA